MHTKFIILSQITKKKKKMQTSKPANIHKLKIFVKKEKNIWFHFFIIIKIIF